MNELIQVAMILLFGTLCAALAYRLKVSNMFFLVLAGMVFGIFGVIDFSNEVIVLLCELTLVFVLFNSTSKLNIKEVFKYSKDSVRLSAAFFILCILVLAPLTFLFFDINPSITLSVLIVLLFAVMMYDTDPATTMSAISGGNKKVSEIMEIESVINTPLMVIISMLLLKMIEGNKESMGNLSSYALHFAQQIFIPLGVGAIIGFVIVYILKNHYFEELSHLVVISSAIIVYALSEMMNGNGVLGVTTFGLIFGNYFIEHKIELEKFASIFAYTLKILVFILLGGVIMKYGSYRTVNEFILGTVLFIVFIVLRFAAVSFTLKGITNFRERLFMTLNMAKGIEVAVVILLVISAISGIEGMDVVMSLTLLFVLYSIVISTISSMFNGWYFEKDVLKNIKIKKMRYKSN